MSTTKQLRLLTRGSAVLAALLTLLGGLAFFLSPSAQASGQERIVLNEGEGIEIPGTAIGASAVGATFDQESGFELFLTPDTCNKVTWCNAYPLTINPPASLDRNEEYYVDVYLEWDPYASIPANPALGGETAVADYDLYILNDPIVPNAGPDEDGKLYTSASGLVPERISMYQPSGNFTILVDNYTGLQPSYTLKVKWTKTPFATPFEKLPPSFSTTGVLPPPAAAPTPVFNIPAPPIATPIFDDAGLDIPPSLTPSQAPVADSAFDSGFDDAPSLTDELGPTVDPNIEFEEAAVKVPEAPSNLALLLWLIAFPLFLLAILGGALLRRREELVTI